MNLELADAVIEAAIRLEEFFFKEYPQIYQEHKEKKKRNEVTGFVTLGNENIKKEVKKLSSYTVMLYSWFNKTRNSILHYGDSEDAIHENEKTRTETSAQDIEKAGRLLLILLRNAKNSNEADDRQRCEGVLGPQAFEKLFGINAMFSQIESIRLTLRHTRAFSKLSRREHELRAPYSKPIESDATDGTNDEMFGVKSKRPDPEAGPKPEAAAGGTSKRIVMKPPISVRDLAARLGLEPFKLIGDLMELNIFASINQSVERDIAAKLCEKHGHTFKFE